MTSLKRLLLTFLLALAPLTFIACGGDEGASDVGSSDEDPDQVLEAAFNNEEMITSGVLDFSLEASAEGAQSGSAQFTLSGPFQGDPEDPAALPQLDWDVSASAEALGQTQEFSGGLTVTEDNAYVTYSDQAYEVGTDMFGQLKAQLEAAAAQQQDAASELSFEDAFKQGCEQSIEQQGGDPSACDFDVTAWFGALSNEGTEEIDGTETVHIAGDIDVEQMLTDLITLGTSVPSAAGGAPTEEQVQMAAEAVEEASFDIFVDGDDLVRQIDFNLSADATQIPEAASSGVEAIGLGFSASVLDVNSEQTVEAPSDAQPIDALLQQLGGLGALGGLGSTGLGADSLGGSDATGADQAAIQECILGATTPEEQAACL
ncbi:MAG: hypothetical protein H0W09_06575 [Solirubrobacterales bacterium]|nr:hypothetical protein [Solirubrobacterales bacterium]